MFPFPYRVRNQESESEANQVPTDGASLHEMQACRQTARKSTWPALAAGALGGVALGRLPILDLTSNLAGAAGDQGRQVTLPRSFAVTIARLGRSLRHLRCPKAPLQ